MVLRVIILWEKNTNIIISDSNYNPNFIVEIEISFWLYKMSLLFLMQKLFPPVFKYQAQFTNQVNKYYIHLKESTLGLIGGRGGTMNYF